MRAMKAAEVGEYQNGQRGACRYKTRSWKRRCKLRISMFVDNVEREVEGGFDFLTFIMSRLSSN